MNGVKCQNWSLGSAIMAAVWVGTPNHSINSLLQMTLQHKKAVLVSPVY